VRLLLISDTFLPKIGGAELAIHNMAEGLVSSGHQVMVGTSMKANGLSFNHSYTIERFFTSRGSYRFKFIELWFTIFLKSKLQTWKPDAIIANYAWPAGFAALKLNNPNHVPIVIISHGADIQIKPTINYGLRLDKNLDRKIGWAIRNSDKLIAISKSIFEEYLSIGASPQRIRIVPNGINYDTLIRPQPYARCQLGLPIEKKIMLGVGRNHPKKRFADLINLMPELASKFPELFLVIVGKDVPRLQKDVEALHLQNNVLLFDEVLPAGIELADSSSQLSRSVTSFYNAADMFVLPSLIEGLPLVGLEAMAAGLPMIAAPAPGIDDLILDGINGIFASVDEKSTFLDSVGILIQDPAKRRAMGLKSREISAKYDRNAVAKEVVTFLKDL
jgi:glycosyltransferase involved in cell wall biosynthesis